MALIEVIIGGGIAGTLVEGGKRGLIRSWSQREELPSIIKLATLVLLVGVPAWVSHSLVECVGAAFTTVGAFTVARWSVASVVVLWAKLRRAP